MPTPGTTYSPQFIPTLNIPTIDFGDQSSTLLAMVHDIQRDIAEIKAALEQPKVSMLIYGHQAVSEYDALLIKKHKVSQ